jgi:integrase
MPGYHAGRPPCNKVLRYRADPPTVDEIVAVMRHASDDPHGWRLRAMIVVLWRAGLRVQQGLALTERDLDQRRGSILVRSGKGGVAARSAWTSGAGSSCALARRPRGVAGRAVVLRDRRSDPQQGLLGRRGPHRVPPARWSVAPA